MSVAAAKLAKRRAQEKIVREREDFLKDECNATYVAQWETRTSIRIDKQDLLNRADRLVQLDEESLKQRQANIRTLYENDKLRWSIKLEELQHVSTDERMNQIREKALRLKDKRERERLEFVNECYERQWRDGCDELRTLNAKAVTDRVMRDRAAMIKSKSQEDQDDTNGSEKAEIQLNESEQEIKIENQKKNVEIKTALDSQVEYIRMKNKRLNEEKRIEERQKLERWKMEEDIEKERKLQARRDAQAQGEEILEANAKRLEDRERDAVVHRKEDKLLLDYALSKENIEIQKEQRQRNQGKEAAKEYLSFLREQMTKEKEDNKLVDTIRNQEMGRIWTKREQRIQERNDAKRHLMAEVHSSRLEQIKEKELRIKKEKEELAKQVLENLQEWHREEQAEKEKHLIKKQETIQNMLANKAVMEERSRQRAKERQEELYRIQQRKNSEQDHRERIKRNAGNVVTYFPRRSTATSSICIT